MSTERKIRLLRNKLHVYKFSYNRAVAEKDLDSAAKWRDGHRHIVERINKLKEAL